MKKIIKKTVMILVLPACALIMAISRSNRQKKKN